MSLYWRVTAPGMREVYDDLSRALRGHDFYLAGGTALALLEGHRVSIDLDLFSPTLDDPQGLLEELEWELEHDISSVALGRNAIDMDVSGVRVSLIRYRYPLIRPVLNPDPDGLPVADRDDIAAMKLSAITNRGSRKDFIDFWLLLDRHRTLPEYLEIYRCKYSRRDVGHVVKSLAYFTDADEDPPLRMLASVSWDQVKTDLRAAVSALL